MVYRDRGDEALLGYRIDIKPGLWERVKSFGVPRVVGSLWFVLWIIPSFLMLVLLGIKFVIVPVLMWLIGQAIMMWLTHLDPYWDDVMIAQVRYRYKAYYEGG